MEKCDFVSPTSKCQINHKSPRHQRRRVT